MNRKINVLNTLVYSFCLDSDTLSLALLSDEQLSRQNYLALYHMRYRLSAITRMDLMGQHVIVQFRSNSVLLMDDRLFSDKMQVYGSFLTYAGKSYTQWQTALFDETADAWPVQRSSILSNNTEAILLEEDSFLTLIFRRPMALYSGASETSLVYTMEYQFWVICLNAIPLLCSTTMGAGLRGYGYSKYEMYGITLGNIMNIILDPIFIFGFHLGVRGAGSATFVSTCISMLYFLIMANRMQKREHLYTEYRDFRFHPDYAVQIITTGFPAFLHSLLASVTNTAAMNIFKGYTDAAVAAIGIVRKIEHTFGQMIIGLNQGVIPLISYNYANKKYHRLKEVRDKTLLLGLFWGLVALVTLFTFARQFILFFINDPDTVRFGIPLVRMYAFIVLTMSYNNNARTVMQALAQKKQSTWFSIFRTVILYVPLLYILNYFFGFYGAAFSTIASDLISDVVAFFLIRNIFQKIRIECEA